MTVTAQTIVKDALIEIGAIGIADTPAADDARLGLRRLNRMIDGWALKNFYASHTGWQVFNLPSSTESLTIGPGGDVDVARPVRVATGSFARSGSVDREITAATRDQWASIILKSLSMNWPEWVYYEASSPVGVLHFWPQAPAEIHLALDEPLAQFADLTTQYTVTPGVEDAMVLSLAELLCRPYSRPLPPTLTRDAAMARRALKIANFQVPELQIGVDRRFLGGDGFTNVSATHVCPEVWADGYADQWTGGGDCTTSNIVAPTTEVWADGWASGYTGP